MAMLRCLVAGAALFMPIVNGYKGFRTSLTLKDFKDQMEERELKEARIMARDNDLEKLYPAHTIQIPIDHFHNDSIYEPHTTDTFALRYWFDATHYKPGGPVIVLQGGETDGAGRLPYLQKGIVAQLSEATNGLGVIFEHRYYGESHPTPDFSTKNLRFLTTDQALADQAYFAQNVVFPGLEHLNLTSHKVPYIAYGGSYAGSVVAFLRKLYPDVYWGAIASSGVPEAIYDYWEYYEAARIYAPIECVEATQKLTDIVDNVLIKHSDTQYPQRIKDVFGLGNITRDDDFANTIAQGIAGLQGLNWDRAVNSTEFGYYCANVSSTTVLYPDIAAEREGEVRELLNVAGYGEHDAVKLVNQFLNYIGYVRDTAARSCRGRSQDDCFTNYNSTFYRQDDIRQEWRLWAYQYCFEWGYLQTGSGVPADQLPLISRLINIEYSSTVCREAFNITTPSQVERINKHGGVNISYPRLAHVDGEWDPWRAASPHRIGLPERESTVSEPFILIEKGVHHWDENGLFPNETRPGLPPKPVAEAQKAEAAFVKAWVQEWKVAKGETLDGDDIGDL
ncbi:putative serine protease [Triangularia verruculosa]|uniref:Serine protease n=1 Tax=Triangularia verruculosa TaxID=2587418 RepID=A0AAN6XAT3_9PEZI|nr:putative serine protease [Triangularia verruculosa]